MTQKPETWKRNSSKKVADCRVFKVREDFCERESDNLKHSFFVIENPDWVNIIALTKKREVVLIEQFRHGIEETILEIPGGMIDDGEEPETAARRELLEETGFSADKFIFLGKSRPNPAIQDNWIYHFAAEDCEKTADVGFDEHESAVTKLVDLDEIEGLISNEKITHSLVLAAFYKFQSALSEQPAYVAYSDIIA
jgi:ADP-ribose pyrophosphatase